MARRIKFRKQTTIPTVLPADYIAYVLDPATGVVTQYMANEDGTAVYPVGIDGATGPQGAAGQDGAAGAAGADGAAGSNGQDGAAGGAGAAGQDGVAGAAGADGTNGTNGTNGTDGTNGTNGVDHSSFTHSQTVSAVTWTVAHALNRYPSVTVVDDSGVVIDSIITYVDADTVTVELSAAGTGKVYCN